MILFHRLNLLTQLTLSVERVLWKMNGLELLYRCEH